MLLTHCRKRPSVEECFEHRWLVHTDFMIKKRERAIFPGSRLKVRFLGVRYSIPPTFQPFHVDLVMSPTNFMSNLNRTSPNTTIR